MFRSVFLVLGVVVTGLRRKSNKHSSAIDHSLNSTGIVENKFPSNWPYLGHCVRPHGEGGLYDKTVRQCKSRESPPFTRDSRIAIVGGGPGGVSMARLLHDRGYTKITLFEKSDRLGGKSQNYNYKGENHDLGTCYLAGKYECIEAWAGDLGLTEKVINVPRYVSSPTTPSQKNANQMLTNHNFDVLEWWMAMKSYGLQVKVNNVAEYVESFGANFKMAGQKYIQEWGKTMRTTEYMFPTNPDFKALNQTFLSWLQERDLTALVPRLHVSTGGQGYGRLDSMPALYGLMWNHPNLLSGFGQHSMIKEGYQTIWDHLLDGTGVDIRFQQSITKITRGSWRPSRRNIQNVKTTTSDDDFDFLVMAAPMPDALAMMDYTDEDLDLFGSFYHHELVATILKESSSGDLPRNYELFTWADTLNVQTDISRRTFNSRTDSASSKMTSQIDGEDGPMTIRQTANIKGFKQNVIGTLQISNTATTDDRLKELVLDSLGDYGIKASVLYQKRWPEYMPHLSLEEIVKDRKPWRMWAHQGNKRTWFVGSYVSFESAADVLDYNIQLVNTNLCEPN